MTTGLKMKTITLELTEQETGNLMAVINAGVRGLGTEAVLPLAPILTKINAAVAADPKHEELE